MSTPWIIKLKLIAPTRSKLELTQHISEQAKTAILEILERDFEGMQVHDSDCALHSEPAYPRGNCDCSVSK